MWQEERDCNLRNVIGFLSKSRRYIKSRTRHHHLPHMLLGRISRPEKEQSVSAFPLFLVLVLHFYSTGIILPVPNEPAELASQATNEEESEAAAASAAARARRRARGMGDAATNHPVTVSPSPC